MILSKNCFWRPKAAKGRSLEVLSGCLWVTKEGENGDQILRSGDTLELQGGGWLVQALGDCPCIFNSSLDFRRTP